jgi:hypothetical protein
MPPNELESLGQAGICDRSLFVLELDRPRLPTFTLPSPHFSCLLVADFGQDVGGLVDALIVLR